MNPCLALSVALAAIPSLEDRRHQLTALLDEQWEYVLRTNPEFASILGDKRYNDKLSDFSEKAVYADIEMQKQFLHRFQAVDTTGFPVQEQLNKALMVRQLEESLAGVRFKGWEMPVTQFSGIHIDAPQLVAVLSFETVNDYDDYIARLRQLPKALDDTAALMRQGMRDRLMPPKILLEQVARQSARLSSGKPEENPFFEPAKKFPTTFSGAEKLLSFGVAVEPGASAESVSYALTR